MATNIPSKESPQPQQEEQAKIGEEWFNIGVPLRISNTIDDKLYVE